jgi:pimeloyl-ACP methyl ester carboxylesterase
MIARLTRFVILLQLLILAGLSALLVSLGWVETITTSLLLVMLMMTLLRAFIVFNNFFLASSLQQPMRNGQRVPLVRMAGRMLQEFWWSMQCWFRFFPLARPFSVTLSRDRLPPVLLLHGYGANSGFWTPLSKHLSTAGISHAAIDLEPIMGSIDDYADRIETAVQKLCAAVGTDKIILVGHSMGGLAARAWLRRYGCGRLARLITLGTPHFGSTLAGYGMGRNARQMLPTLNGDQSGDDWLTTLATAENTDVRARITSIYSLHDNIVAPQRSAVLPDAVNRAFDLVGHVALGFDRDVMEQLIAEIRTCRQNTYSAGS